MTSWVSRLARLVLVLAATSTTFTKAQLPVSDDQCACPFAADNEVDCFVYGDNPDGNGLVAYPRIGDECIESIEARSSFLSPLDFWIYCPDYNGTMYNLEYFLILLRQKTKTPEAQYVMSQFIVDMTFPIFEQDPETGMYDIVDVLTNNQSGNQFNCTEKENECWNQVKAQVRERSPRWKIICNNWTDTIIPQFKADQATARRKLCEGGFNETELELCFGKDDIKERSDCAALEPQVEPENAPVPLCNEPTRAPSGAMGTTTKTWGVMLSLAAAMVAGMVF